MKTKPGILLLFLLVAAMAGAQRLPGTIVPERYQLRLTPDLGAARFAGDETIEVRVLQPTSTVVLNALDLQVDTVTIGAGGTAQKAKVAFQPEQETMTLTVPQQLPAGAAQIQIQYGGVLSDKLRGFYLAQESGHRFAVTQFEPTDARRAFPSFDEPAYKAVFDVSVVAPVGATAISNGRIVADEPGPGAGRHTIRFAATPKMSTYLVAWLVGEFQCIQGGAEDVPIRVCTPPGKQEMGRFALRAAEQFLKYFNHYFSVPYPYGKLDLIAVPDFEAGAMENTAAITFRDVDLLLDEKLASMESMREVALVISHEMAHQWFGDLVTMQWWDDIWLNEGFATWMESKAVAAWKPEWRLEMEEQDSADQAMAIDSLRHTRPIRQAAENSAQINELFDAIAYNKTAAVLRMLEAYEGPEVFRRGVNRYIESHLYANATAQDFWTAEATASQRPVDRIMASFVNNTGVPLVSGEFHCGGRAGILTLSQRRFFLDPSFEENTKSEPWTIPVCLPTGSEGGAACTLLTEVQQILPVADCRSLEWINAGAQGYFRSLSRGKETPDAPQELTEVERLALVDNEWALVRAGLHPIGSFLSLAERLKSDRNAATMKAVNRHLRYVGEYLLTDRDRQPYRAWLQGLLRPTMTELGWRASSGDSSEARSLRATVFYTLGYTARDPEALAQAEKLLREYTNNPTAVDPSLLDTVFSLAAIQGNTALYDQLLARSRESTDPETHYRYLYSLAQFSDPALLTRTLEHALSPAVRGQNTAMLIGAVMRNPAGGDLAWQFAKGHWDVLVQKVSLWGAAAMVRYTSYLCSPGAKQDTQQFFATHPFSAAERGLQQSLEEIQNCVQLKGGQQSALDAWLTRRGGAAGK